MKRPDPKGAGHRDGRPDGRFAVGLDVSALDASFKEHAARGIGRYVRELSAFLAAAPSPGVTVGTFDFRDVRVPDWAERAVSLLPAGRQTVRQQIFYPLSLRKGRLAGFDVLHFPAHMDAPTWSATPTVVTVLDLIPLVLRDLYEKGAGGPRFRLARALEVRAIKAASLVLAISECTKRDVVRLLGVPEQRIVVTPLGVDPRFSPVRSADDDGATSRYGLPPGRPVVLYVGGIDERKNVRFMLEVFARVVAAADARGPRPVLVVAGRTEGDRNHPALLADVERLGLGDDVVRTGFVADADLPALYRSASVFFFPSLYEGFGLPPLEALACGTAVASSDTSSMPEVLGDAALYFRPDDAASATAAVSALLGSRDLRAGSGAKGPGRAALFSWADTGRRTAAAYRRLADERR